MLEKCWLCLFTVLYLPNNNKWFSNKPQVQTPREFLVVKSLSPRTLRRHLLPLMVSSTLLTQVFRSRKCTTLVWESRVSWWAPSVRQVASKGVEELVEQDQESVIDYLQRNHSRRICRRTHIPRSWGQTWVMLSYIWRSWVLMILCILIIWIHQPQKHWWEHLSSWIS